jgi:hypothetical protein
MTPSNDDRRVPPVIDPHRYDHLVPPAKRLLKATAKATWKMMRLLMTAAFRIPGLVKKHTAKQPDKTISQ